MNSKTVLCVFLFSILFSIVKTKGTDLSLQSHDNLNIYSNKPRIEKMIEYLRINDSILNRIDSKHNISNRDTRLCFDTKICIDKRNRFLNYFIYKKIKWIYPDFWVNGDTISYEKLKSEILRSKADKSKLIYESIDIDPSKENCEYFVTFVQLTENVMKMTVKPFEECVLCDKWITIILRFSDDEIVDVEVLEFMS